MIISPFLVYLWNIYKASKAVIIFYILTFYKIFLSRQGVHSGGCER